MKRIVPFLLLPAVLAAPAADQSRSEPATSFKLRSPRDWTPVDAEGVARRLASLGEDQLSKRDPGDVLLCTEPNFGGECATVAFTIDSICLPIPAPFTKNLGSIRPDKGALCRLTTTSAADGCDLHGDLFVESPGYENLFALDGVDYGSEAHHLKCQKCTNCQGDDE